MMRRPFIAGNWKLHNSVRDSVALALAIAEGVKPGEVDVVIAPVFTSLAMVASSLNDAPHIALAGQDVHWEDKGAFTGEVSAPLLRDVGCRYVIVGHSERRQFFGETNDVVRRKVDAAFRGGLTPIACVGETLEEREAGKTLEVVLGQLDAISKDLAQLDQIVIAYEPVWAIGTGRVAKPEDAQAVHAAIRERLAVHAGAEKAAAIRVLYGGSVKADNAKGLFSQADIDGALVGGASLDATSFLAIIESAR